MIRLFKLAIFFILLSTQIFPQNLSRLKAKKAREKQKKLKINEEEIVEQTPDVDSLKAAIQNDEIVDLPIVKSEEELVDSLVIELRKTPEKVIEKKVIISKVNLAINTIPENVEISLDGNILGNTPLAGKKISSGNHTFQIQKDGYAPISYDINVNPSKSVSLDFFMNPVYDIKFKTDEVGLTFELNSTHRWTEDIIRMKLEAGDHSLRVYKFGEIIDEQIINADQPLTFQYYLKKGTVAKPGT